MIESSIEMLSRERLKIGFLCHPFTDECSSIEISLGFLLEKYFYNFKVQLEAISEQFAKQFPCTNTSQRKQFVVSSV